MSTNEPELLQELCDALTRRLHAREMQAATLGFSADPSITIEIEELKDKIEQVQQRMLNLPDTKQAKDIFLISNIANTALEFASSALIENEAILIKVLRNVDERAQAYYDMLDLFHVQKNRGQLAKWIGFIETHQDKNQSTKINELIKELLVILETINEIFYHSSQKEGYRIERFLKRNMIQILHSEDYASAKRFAADKDRIISSIESYLESIRNLIERLGKVAGKLQALI